MNEVTIASGGISPCRSPSLEQAQRELSQMPVTEACVSGLCEICIYQTGLCMVFGRRGENPERIQAFGGAKNK